MAPPPGPRYGLEPALELALAFCLIPPMAILRTQPLETLMEALRMAYSDPRMEGRTGRSSRVPDRVRYPPPTWAGLKSLSLRRLHPLYMWAFRTPPRPILEASWVSTKPPTAAIPGTM